MTSFKTEKINNIYKLIFETDTEEKLQYLKEYAIKCIDETYKE